MRVGKEEMLGLSGGCIIDSVIMAGGSSKLGISLLISLSYSIMLSWFLNKPIQKQ